jgi:hypothetical protein
MNVEIKGTIYFKGEVELIGANQLKKQILVVETNEEYPQKVPVEFMKDKVDLLNNLAVGHEVSLNVNIRGNEYTDRNGQTRFGLCFQGWKLN